MWLTKSRKVTRDGKTVYYPATGYLEERLRNVRKRSSGPGSGGHMPEEDPRRLKAFPGAHVCSKIAEDFVQKISMKYDRIGIFKENLISKHLLPLRI